HDRRGGDCRPAARHVRKWRRFGGDAAYRRADGGRHDQRAAADHAHGACGLFADSGENTEARDECNMYRSRLTSAAFSRSRRRFVQGLAGGALAAVSVRHCGWVAAAEPAAAGDAGSMLSGTEFNLEIGTLAVNFTGQPAIATAVNGRLPAPLLRWREGDAITLRV